MPLTQGVVQNPASTSLSDGSNPVLAVGKQGEQLASEVHGKWYTINKRGNVFTANVTGATIPVNATTLGSVFAIYNPRNSGVDCELIDLDITTVLATLVVNSYGLY